MCNLSVYFNVCREIGKYSISKQKMMSFRGQASWVKMMSPGGIGMPADKKVKKLIN